MAEIPIFAIKGKPTVAAKINGQATQLLLDTGAVNSALYQKHVEKNGWKLKHEGGDAIGLGGISARYVMFAEQFELDKFQSKNIRLLVFSEIGGDPKFDGILGGNFLLNQDVEFDFVAKKLRLFQSLEPTKCADANLAYWDPEASTSAMLTAEAAEDKRAFVEITLNGKKFKALLDTGANLTMIDKSVVEALGIAPDANAAKFVYSGIGQKPQTAYQQQFEQFIIGTEQITKPKFAVSDMWANARADQKALATTVLGEENTKIIIGMDFLHNYRILFAPSQNKVYLSYVGAPKAK